MGRLEELRKFKKKWGYDDFHVGTGGRMEAFGVDDDLRDRVVKTLFALDPEKAAKFRAKLENPEAVNLDGLKLLLGRAEGDHAELMRDLGEMADAIRFNTGAPPPALIGRVAEALGEAHPKARELADWQRDLSAPYDPMQTALAVSILNRVRDRATVDRTAAIDQVAGKIYSTDRRAELVDLTRAATGGKGHYIAEAYGLRTIKDMTATEEMSGIRNVHDESSVYQRDTLKSDLNKKLKAVYNACKSGTGRAKVTLREGGDLPKYSGAKMFFVNTANADLRLNQVYTDDWIDPEDPGLRFKPYFDQIVTLDQNIHVLLMTKGSPSDRDLQTFKGHLLGGSGSTPSAYAIERAESSSRAVDLLSEPSMLDAEAPPNDAALDAVATGNGATRLAALPGTHPMQQTARAAAQMVTGLQDALGRLQEPSASQFKQNTLVRSALDKIGRLMQVMPSYAEDTPRFSRLFDLLVDEVYLVLATCKPYSIDSYHDTTAKVTEERIPILTDREALPEAQHKTFLVSTGMGAMSAAIESAYARTGSRKLHLVDNNKETSHTANYFEVEQHLIGESVSADMLSDEAIRETGYTPPVIMATLNPSTPTNPEKDGAKAAWTLDDLSRNVRAVLDKHDARLKAESCDKPAVLVIDATVERDGTGETQEMNRVVADFAEDVKAGRLEIIFIKSYQKYPSLGAGKAMAGGLTVIGNAPQEGEPFAGEPWATAQRSETDEAIMDNDEAQIVTHFLTHETDVERKMLARAAKNAGFVRSFLPAAAALPDMSPMAYDAGLPFLALPNSNIAVGTAGQGDRLLDELLINQGVEPRMSFGFQNTSGLPTSPGMMRIGIGQESEAELVEKLYATLMLVTKGASADHTKHDKAADDYLPEGRAGPDEVRNVAKRAADTAFRQISDGLALGRDTDAAREVAIKRLRKAGLLGAEETPEAGKLPGLLAELSTQAREHAEARAAETAAGAALTAVASASEARALLDHPVPEAELDLARVAQFEADEEDKWRRDVANCLLEHSHLLAEMPDLQWRDAQARDHLDAPETPVLRGLLADLAEVRKTKARHKVEGVLAANAKRLAEAGLALPDPLEADGADLPENREAAAAELARLGPAFDPSEAAKRLDKILELRSAPASDAAREALARAPEDVFEAGELEGLEDKTGAELQALLSRLSAARQQSMETIAVKDPANEAWREKTVTALLRAGMLAPGNVVRGAGQILAPDDAELDRLMGEIDAADAATPAGLKKKLAVVTALRKTNIRVESLELSRTIFPSRHIPKDMAARAEWRDGLRDFLGEDCPAEGAEESAYLTALDAAKAPWRARAVAVLQASGKPVPETPPVPVGEMSEGQTRAHARAQADYDGELRLALADLDDVTAMHGAVAVGFDLPDDAEVGVEATYLANIVASCASTQLAAMQDEEAFCDLMDTLRAVGLDQLSHEACERLMDRRGKIALKSLAGGDFDSNLKDLGKIAASFPYGEGPGRLLTGLDLQKVIAKPEDAEAPFSPFRVKAIADALLSGMTLAEAADALPGLVREAAKPAIEGGRRQKAQKAGTTEQKALAQAVALHVRAALAIAEAPSPHDPGQTGMQKPHLFSDGEEGAHRGLEPMTAEEIGRLKASVQAQIDTALGFDVLP